MHQHFRLRISLFLFCLPILLSSCSGQVKTNPAQETIAKPISNQSDHPKISKTQGSDQYQNVHCGLQDRRGNLWFGTTGEGVYRFDGKQFIQYTEKDGLSSNTIWEMAEDNLGNLWFGTKNGICRYDGKAFSKISITANINAVSNYAVWSVMKDKKGTIWFGTDIGLYTYDGKTFEPFLANPTIINTKGLTLKSLQCIFEDKKGNIWLGSGPQAQEGIVLFDGRSLTNFKPENEGWIRTITEDKYGTIILATRHHSLITYDGNTFSKYSSPKELAEGLLNNILVDSKGNIWYGSDYSNDRDPSNGGVWKFDGKSFTELTKKDGLTNSAAYAFVEDKAGNIWIGTRDNGLYRYDGEKIVQYSE